jgi:hypothetical protein
MFDTPYGIYPIPMPIAIFFGCTYRNLPGYLSTVEHGEAEIGAAVLLSTAREFNTSLEWLLTGDQKDC